jgi:hypothetical protein
VARNRITDLFRKKSPESFSDKALADKDGELLLLEDLLPSPDAGPDCAAFTTNSPNHEELKMRKRWIFLAPLAILAMVLFIAIGGEVVMLLWNWLLPQLFGWHEISFWQGLGILLLCRILFGGFGHHGFYRSRFSRRMAERWEGMTPEERERFRTGMRTRCGFGSSTSESTGQ